MWPGISDDLQLVNDAKKTAIIDRELAKWNIDIAALQETRLAESGSLKEKEYTFFWQGLGPDEHCIHGVGILSSVQPPLQGTERIISLLHNTSCSSTHVFSAHAPTLSSSAEVKDVFYEELEVKIRGILGNENLILLGDLNARVGAHHRSSPNCMGHFGVGKLNENGQQLLKHCSFNTSVSPTPSLPPSHTIECPGDTPDLSTGTSWTLSSHGNPY
ncbi:craniofacial development protein 2 [Elysia marginata]|uniref:Craniofacial development protein 2 n=1 Tax=Elysia marginata TaxID=1093978 RepID=A0AAV4F8W4_9GAST|nr:craniofacial development protein 2 [Elysia marginata]